MSDTFTGETYNTLCNDAEEYLANESPEQARELLQKAISLIGTRPRGRSLLADTCMSMELWAEARSQLEILITLDEGNSDSNFRLAQVLEELGEYQLALDNFNVVLDDDSNHHGAKVAIRRIEARTKDSGVNLADIFNSPANSDTEKTSSDDEKENVKDGMQIFPDTESDSIFADSEEEEEDASVDKLLENIGLSVDSTEKEENDISELLENIGVSTSQALQSAFGVSEESDGEQTPGLQTDHEDTSEEKEEVKKAVPSLDEIFGAPSSFEEETEPEAEETEPEEPEEEKAEEVIEKETSPFALVDDDKSSEFSFSSSNTLEAIFNTPEAEETVAEEEPEAEAEEPEEEKAEEAVAEEEPEAEAEEPEEEKAEEAIEEEEPEAEEAVEEEEPETEAEEPEKEKAEEAVAEEEPEAEAEEPEEEETEEAAAKEDTRAVSFVMKQDADFRIDPWSSESGLITIHLTSGTVSVRESMLSVYEKPLQIVDTEAGMIELSGEGTFLLNCGSEEPLIIEVKKDMIIRKDAVILHTGTIASELLDIADNDSIYVIKEEIRGKAIFIADHPVRIILLGDNNRAFYVRTLSIVAADPEILLSHTGTPGGYTEVTGSGKVYLIE